MLESFPLELFQLVTTHLTPADKIILAEVKFDHRLGCPRDVEPSDCDTVASADYILKRLHTKNLGDFIQDIGELAISNGNLELVEWLLVAQKKYFVEQVTISDLIMCDDGFPFKSFQWFISHQENDVLDENVWYEYLATDFYSPFRISEDDYEGMKWVISRKEFSLFICQFYNQAAEMKSVKILDWLESQDVDFPETHELWEAAADTPDNAEVLDWIKKRCPYEIKIEVAHFENIKWFKKNNLSVIVSGNAWKNLEHAKWLYKNGYPVPVSPYDIEDILRTSLTIPMLDWLYEIQADWPESMINAFNYALTSETTVEILEWFYSHNFAYDDHTIWIAINKCKEEIIRWFLEKNPPLAMNHFVTAVQLKKYETAHEIYNRMKSRKFKPPGGLEVYKAAAAENKMDYLCCLYSSGLLPGFKNGYEWTEIISIDMLTWLEDKMDVEMDPAPTCVNILIEMGNLDIIKWFHGVVDFASYVRVIIQKGSLDIVKWAWDSLYEAMLPTKEAMHLACMNSLDVVKFIYETQGGDNMDEYKCVSTAENYGHIDIVAFIHSRGMYARFLECTQ